MDESTYPEPDSAKISESDSYPDPQHNKLVFTIRFLLPLIWVKIQNNKFVRFTAFNINLFQVVTGTQNKYFHCTYINEAFKEIVPRFNYLCRKYRYRSVPHELLSVVRTYVPSNKYPRYCSNWGVSGSGSYFSSWSVSGSGSHLLFKLRLTYPDPVPGLCKTIP